MDLLPVDLILIIESYADKKFKKQTCVLNKHWFKALKCYSYTIQLSNNKRLKEAVSILEQKNWPFGLALRKSVRLDAEHVAQIANLTQLTSLDFGELLVDRDTMHRFTTLTNLREIKSPTVAAVTAANPRLKSARLGSSTINDRDILVKCTNLETLSLEGRGTHEHHCIVFDLASQLTYLSVEHCDQNTIVDLTAMTKLKALRIAYLPTHVKIGTLTNLDWLSIEGHYMLLDSISMLTNLTYLRMDVAPNGESYDGLMFMTKLEVLKLNESTRAMDEFFPRLQNLRVFVGLKWTISPYNLSHMNAEALEELSFFPGNGQNVLSRFTNLRKLGFGIDEVWTAGWDALAALPYLTLISSKAKGNNPLEYYGAHKMTQLKVFKTRGKISKQFQSNIEYIRANEGGEGLLDLTNLESLQRFGGRIGIDDSNNIITYLSTLPMTALTNYVENTSDLFWTHLQRMTDLVHLTICDNESERLCLLTSLNSLTRLRIRNKKPLTGEFISKLTQLQELEYKCKLTEEAQKKFDNMPLLYKYAKTAVF